MRYIIPLYPPFILIATEGLYRFSKKLNFFTNSYETSIRPVGLFNFKLTFIIILLCLLIALPVFLNGVFGIIIRNSTHKTRIQAVKWICDQSSDKDLILAQRRYASVVYYSGLSVLPLEAFKIDERPIRKVINPHAVFTKPTLRNAVSSHKHTYLLICRVSPYGGYADVSGKLDWIDKTYGLIRLNTFVTQFPHFFGLNDHINRLLGIGLFKPEIWDIYVLREP